MRPNRRMPGTQRPTKQETQVSDHQESPAFMRGEEVKPTLRVPAEGATRVPAPTRTAFRDYACRAPRPSTGSRPAIT